jgi:hypothetical protein
MEEMQLFLMNFRPALKFTSKSKRQQVGGEPDLITERGAKDLNL